MNPYFLQAFAKWLELCDSKKLPPEQVQLLDQWATKEILHRANLPNVKGQLHEAPLGAAFSRFELYCFDYPKNRERPRYKLNIKQVVQQSEIGAAAAYAKKFFLQIAKSIRRDENHQPAETEDERAHREQKTRDALYSGTSFENKPGAGELIALGSEAGKRLFQNLTDRQRLVFWADYHGIPMYHPELLRLADCSKTTTSAENKTVYQAAVRAICDALPIAETTPDDASTAYHQLLHVLYSEIKAWAAAQALHPDQILASLSD